ncbi:MAG: MBL fold metallo-hydrolase [Thermomicrobiales bacterium]
MYRFNPSGKFNLLITLTFLGTGTSTGIPVIGCDCDVCRSPDPRDNRLRASVLVQVDGTNLLIDTSPDMREQMLRADCRRIDAVLFTHTHADHIAGLDELRRYNIMQEVRIPVWATAETGEELSARFAYAFTKAFPFFGAKPDLDLNIFEGPFQVNGIEIIPIPIQHGTLPIVGFRIGNFAYITDAKRISESSLAMLDGLDTLVITALRKREHPAHMSLAEALAAIEQINPKRAFLSHLGHDMGRHADVSLELPAHVLIATDRLVVEIA